MKGKSNPNMRRPNPRKRPSYQNFVINNEPKKDYTKAATDHGAVTRKRALDDLEDRQMLRELGLADEDLQ